MNADRSLYRTLQSELRAILRAESFIYIDSIEPERDRLPVPRGLVEGAAEAFDLAARKIEVLEQMARDLSTVLRETLQHQDPVLRSHPNVLHAVQVLTTVEELLSR